MVFPIDENVPLNLTAGTGGDEIIFLLFQVPLSAVGSCGFRRENIK
jgi:hypothetical protein